MSIQCRLTHVHTYVVFRAQRRPTDLSPVDVPDSPTFSIGSIPDSPLLSQPSVGRDSPPLHNEPIPQVTAKPVLPSPASQTLPATRQRPTIATTSKQAPAVTRQQSLPSSSSTSTSTSTQGKSLSRRASREKKVDSRSRLPSITHLQEKLKKRWPRTLRITGVADIAKEKEKSTKYWKSAPRLVCRLVSICMEKHVYSILAKKMID